MGDASPSENNVTDYGITSIEEHADYPIILIVICMLSVFSVAGTIGNAFVIYVFSKQREKPSSTIFIITLAGTDFFTCLIIVPLTIVMEYFNKRIWSNALCKLYQFFITSNVPFSFFIMVAIAFDRYFKICRPWTHAMDPPVAKMVIVGLLIFAVALGVITAFAYEIYEPKVIQNITSNLNDKQSANATVMGDNQTRTFFMSTTPSIDAVSLGNKNLSEGATTTATSVLPEEYYYGRCMATEKYISTDMRLLYQKFYASLFLIAFILVVILYGLILRSIVSRRAKKLNKSMNNGGNGKSNQTSTASQTCITSSKLVTNEEIKMAGTSTEENFIPEKPSQVIKEKEREKIKSIREKQRIANIKTAGILFMVTFVFIIAFLPAWLMAVRLIPAGMILFYMYFSYNVANPIIYAFFNRSFRSEMKNVMHCKQSTSY